MACPGLRAIPLLLSLLLGACAASGDRASSQARSLIAQGDEFFARDRSQAALRAYTLAALAADEEQQRELLVCALAQVAAIHFLGRAEDASLSVGETWLGEARLQAREQEPAGWVRYRLACGHYELALGKTSAASAVFAEAAAFAQGAGLHAQELQAAHMAGRCCVGERRGEWLERCVEIARGAGERGWELPLHFNLGAHHEEAGRAARAREAYADALEAARDVGLADEELAAAWSAGRMARQAGERGLASTYLESARLLAGQRAERVPGDTSLAWIARCELELGELDASRGAREPALVHWKAARYALLPAATRGADFPLASEIEARIRAFSPAASREQGIDERPTPRNNE